MIIGPRYQIAMANPFRGGMSEVHVGSDLHLDRQVVLKCLQPFQEPQRIVDEQKALQEVTSKHVVQLLDIVTENLDGRLQTFLVIEYVEGHDLREFIFDYDERYLLILWQIATGLSEIHRFSIIHRDIKPGNIRIDQEGVAKIFDFGLARQQGLNNKTQGAIGTPHYIAPEMLVDSTISFTTAADVFSFAITALNLLNRKPPEWNNQLPRAIPANAVVTHVPEFPHRLSEVLQRCLSENPADRPDMDEVCTEISRVLLHDKHSAQLVLGGNVSVIDKNRRDGFPKVVRASTDIVVSGLRIHYDGNDFIVVENIGNVVANNMPILPGQKLTPSCVLAFPNSGARPFYATFNVNQPEVFV